MNQFHGSMAARRASQSDWPPTRAEGLARLESFAPSAGRVYARERNHDFGPEARVNVSLLSPYVRRRLVLESELVAAALAAHPPEAAQKFVEEVFWRTYWSGWLEQRPSVWADYRAGLEADRAAAAADRGLAARLTAAEEGAAGIAPFDAWARELAETGYLHNHARMWFASIWIFTLRLPWRLGADLFHRRLLDGDPASNTLSWRWVAGLHTRGKAYVATAANIAAYTGGRFAPLGDALDESAMPLEEDPAPPPRSLPPSGRLDPEAPAALLLTTEDLHPESLWPDLSLFRAAATLQLTAERSPAAVAPAVAAFDRGALADAAQRAEAAGAPMSERLAEIAPEDLARWARRSGAAQVATAWVPVGPVRDWLDRARPALAEVGARLVMVRRAWDEAAWPHATAGFFRLRAAIPELLRAAL